MTNQCFDYFNADAKQLLMMYGRRRLEESSSGPVLDVRDTVIEENERRAPETQHSENSFLMKRYLVNRNLLASTFF